MRLSKFSGLLALSIIILSSVVPVHAQGLSKGVGTVDVAATILPAQSVVFGTPAVSGAIPNPSELLSVEYDATGGTGFDAPAIAVKYSNSPTGPWVVGTGSGFDNTVTVTVTPTSAAPIKPYNFAYAQFTLTATATGTIPLKRFTALRRKISDRERPTALTDRATPIAGFAGIIVAAAGSSAVFPTQPLVSADEWIAFFLASTGGAGESRTLRLFYSNSASGPFIAWEDPGSIGYQNSVAGTAITMAWHVKPFPALFMKARLDKASGAAMPVQALIGTHRVQIAK